MKNPTLTSEASQFPRKTKQRAPKVGAQTESPHGKQWLCHRPTCSCCMASPPTGLCSPSLAATFTRFPHWRLDTALSSFSLAQKPGVFTGATETSRDNKVGTDAKDATAMTTSVPRGALPPGDSGLPEYFLIPSVLHPQGMNVTPVSHIITQRLLRADCPPTPPFFPEQQPRPLSPPT